MRVRDKDKDRLLICLAISLALHFVVFLPFLIFGGMQALNEMFNPRKEPPPELQAPRLVFLRSMPDYTRTSRAQESKQAPKNPEYVSDKNTLAGDQSKRTDQNNPEIKGIDRQIITPLDGDIGRTVRKKAAPTQQAKSSPEQERPTQEKPGDQERKKSEPAPQQTVKTDLALLKTNPVPASAVDRVDEPVEAQQVQQQEVEALEDARAPPAVQEPSVSSNLTGGISRKGVVAFDTQDTPGGRYDKIMFQAIGQRWYSLLNDQYRNQIGLVIVEYTLYSDGRVGNIKLISTGSVGPILQGICKQAIEDSAPFRSFPEPLQAFWGESRQVRAAFEFF